MKLKKYKINNNLCKIFNLKLLKINILSQYFLLQNCLKILYNFNSKKKSILFFRYLNTQNFFYEYIYYKTNHSYIRDHTFRLNFFLSNNNIIYNFLTINKIKILSLLFNFKTINFDLFLLLKKNDDILKNKNTYYLYLNFLNNEKILYFLIYNIFTKYKFYFNVI